MPVVLSSITGSELPLTVADLIAATRDHLQGTYRSEWLVLAGDIGAGDTTISFTTPYKGAVRTTYLAIDDEILYVLDNPSTDQAQVIRGWDGTRAAAHQAGTPVEVGPRFPRHMIRRQLAMEIASWPDNLFQVATKTINLVADGKTASYDLGVPANDVLYLLDVRHAPWLAGQSRNSWPQFLYPPRLNRTVDKATFPSGVALDIKEAIHAAVECVITYATRFDLTNMDDSVQLGAGGIGLATSMVDIPPLGAAARLIGPREALRTFNEAADNSRDPQDVPPGSALKVGMYLKSLRDARIREEMEHLEVTWPARAK